MRIRFLFGAALAAATLLGGCSRDPQINGPFLVGAERPAVRDGACCPLGDVRSQDVNRGYAPCKQERGRCSVGKVSGVSESPSSETYVDGLKGPSRPVDMDKVYRSLGARHPQQADPERSAWQ
jgi:hypothetical protein